MPCAYIIVDTRITDLAQFRKYMAETPAAVAAAGGEYLARGGAHAVLEGDWQPSRLVMLRFPSLDAAKAFYDAEPYRVARAKRQGATEFFNMVVVEGVPD